MIDHFIYAAIQYSAYATHLAVEVDEELRSLPAIWQIFPKRVVADALPYLHGMALRGFARFSSERRVNCVAKSP